MKIQVWREDISNYTLETQTKHEVFAEGAFLAEGAGTHDTDQGSNPIGIARH